MTFYSIILILIRMLRRFITKAFYQELKTNLIQNFGIKTPEIQRNLKYYFYHLECLTTMRLEPSETQLILKPGSHVSLTLERSWPSLGTSQEGLPRTRGS